MKVYSVTEYREELNQLLGQVTVAIRGEVSDFSISQNRFVWFTLADEQTVVKCFMMAFHLKTPLEDGMEVQVVGSPTMFKKGQVVFRPRQVEVVGDGSLQRAYELLKKQLEKEGLFDDTRKRSLPRFPQRIGLVTSRDAAAYTDVLRILDNRWSGIEIVHAYVNVQGQQAESSITAALAQLNEEYPDLDCLILTRGGGSLEDLHAFNSENVVRAVFASTIPVVSGVGHERDSTLTDFVADVRASTPSNAAEMVVPDKSDVQNELLAATERMHRAIRAALVQKQHDITAIIHVLDERARQQVSHFDSVVQRLLFGFHSMEAMVRAKRDQVEAATHLLQSLNPTRLFTRGYSMTTTPSGQLIKTVSAVKKGQTIVTRFHDGNVQSVIEPD